MPRRRTQALPLPTIQQAPPPKAPTAPSKKKKRGKRKQSRGLPKAAALLVAHTCGVTNPFCDAALVSKYPDAHASRSLVFRSRSRTTVTNNAAGNSGIIFMPGFTYFAAGDAVVTTPGTIVVATLGATAGSATFTGASAYRINSWGLRMRAITSATTNGGMLRIRSFAPVRGTNLGTIDMRAYTSDFAADIPVSACRDVAVIGKKINSNANLFVRPVDTNPNANVVDWVSPGWGAIACYVDGGQASTVSIDYEYVINFELSFDDGDAMNTVATPAADLNTKIQAAADYAADKVGQVFTAGVESVDRAITNAAQEYFRERYERFISD